MSDDCMRVIRIPVTLEDFDRLPRNPAYSYEYEQGYARLLPRPRHYHGLLQLNQKDDRPATGYASLREKDWESLVPLFAGSFRHIAPFGGLTDSARIDAARRALEQTRDGGDGPWLTDASFVADIGGEQVGALLVTLLPPGDPNRRETYSWEIPPPADAIARRVGRPHLTWIFVAPDREGLGIGTNLLGVAVQALKQMGFTELLSTFMVGNDASLLWHWKNGFRLLPSAKPHLWRSSTGI